MLMLLQRDFEEIIFLKNRITDNETEKEGD